MSRRSRDADTARFAVGDPIGRRSAVWRIWVNGSDVYLAAREIAGLLKVSLHESGNWRYAFTAQSGLLPIDAVNGDRAVNKWKRPAEFAPGWTKALVVVVPASEIVPSSIPVEKPRQVAWYPQAPVDWVTCFTVLYSKTRANDGDWPGKQSMGTNLVDRFEISNGETVWVTEHQEPLSPGMKDNIVQLRGRIDTLVRAHATEVDWAKIDPFAVVFMTHDIGTRTCLEIATTPEVVDALRQARPAKIVEETTQ